MYAPIILLLSIISIDDNSTTVSSHNPYLSLTQSTQIIIIIIIILILIIITCPVLHHDRSSSGVISPNPSTAMLPEGVADESLPARLLPTTSFVRFVAVTEEEEAVRFYWNEWMNVWMNELDE